MADLQRRQLLSWLLASPLLLQTASGKALAASLAFASAATRPDGQHTLSIFNLNGALRQQHRLPDRAHQVLAHPQRPWVFTLARRPGYYLDIYDYRQQQQVALLQPQPGHHFNGHAQLSADLRYLLTSEQPEGQDQGLLVLRDLERNFQVVDAFPTHGIEPHEFQLLPDRQTLVVANGGIRTRGREKLDVEAMQPSLVYLDARNGQLLEQQQLAKEYHQCSIRHLDSNAEGQLILALQYEGHPADEVPLILAHRRGEALQPLQLPESIRSQLQQYCGSACFDASGRYAAVSSPKGNLVTCWDMTERRFLQAVPIVDGCGLAATNSSGEFVVSGGRGHLYRIQATDPQRHSLADPGSAARQLMWDNHLALLPQPV